VRACAAHCILSNLDDGLNAARRGRQSCMPLDSGKPPRRRIEGAQDPARLLVRVCHEPQLHLRDPGVDRILGHDAIVGWYVHGHVYSHARTHTHTRQPASARQRHIAREWQHRAAASVAHALQCELLSFFLDIAWNRRRPARHSPLAVPNVATNAGDDVWPCLWLWLWLCACVS